METYRLQEAFEELHTARSLADTLQTVADGIVNSLGFELACVHLVRPDGDLVVASFAGDPATEALITGRVGSRNAWEKRLSIAEDWGALCYIPHTSAPACDADDIPQWPTSDRPARYLENAWDPADRLFGPMYITGANGSELFGVISVDRPRNGRRPGPEQREALQTYVFQAAIAISNARLRANMQRALVHLEREQKAMRASEESFRQAFEYAPSGMAIAEMGGDQHGRILRTNDALCRLLGRPATAMRRYTFSDLVHPEDIDTLLRTSAEGGRAELRLGRRDGTYVWVSLRNSVVADAADGPRFLLTHVEDIEERKLRELQLLHQVSHDALTDLPNITELRSHLSARLCSDPDDPADADPEDGALSHRHLTSPEELGNEDGKGLAVLICDLDGFKSINDRFGDHTGDAVLIEVARRLTSGTHDENTVARLRGGKFAVLADGLGRTGAQDLAVRMRNAIISPIRIDVQALRVGASFGIAWARCGMTADDVLKTADERMHIEKRSHT
ncbi:diguanylate cyclase CdgB [Streptomyces sp. NBC_01381]|uniref:diguanylate cyclase CdgB n=1 Tax=Streptomyces sp. NBC_01381 TaxID=2903845 RepID=UPI00224CCFD5|nr:diguanylate cyclase CdgB [Streptomyces sp. NBC_01381]MCX4673570.1 diguanylate cyclase CdgB [Streptomyces sp. NBC_01381]